MEHAITNYHYHHHLTLKKEESTIKLMFCVRFIRCTVIPNTCIIVLTRLLSWKTKKKDNTNHSKMLCFLFFCQKMIAVKNINERIDILYLSKSFPPLSSPKYL